MGVKDLWSIVAPVGRHVPLSQLSGQTLAVDLSIWVVETQGVKKMHGVVKKPHLRNLFFRISHLTRLGVKLVFAIEGAAPDLKLETMSKRQNGRGASRFNRGRNKEIPAKKPTRSRFNGVLRECCEMLDYLGIPYVQSRGEAEAMCAVLNSEGLVNGCITNDGDAFLYGARVVYRNFTMNSKDPHVDMYRMDDVEQVLGLSREKLVAMALLLGCDYMPQGVPGVGRELAGKLMKALAGVDVLKRMEEWRSDDLMDDLEAHVVNKKLSHCVLCHHPGSQRHHDRWGCTYCESGKSCIQNVGTSCPCDWHGKQHQVELRAAECSVRQKAMKLLNFPPMKVIQEFLQTKDKVSSLKLAWVRPRLFQFQRFSCVKMEWVDEYSLAKLLPLLTLHEMTSMLVSGRTPTMQPHSLIKSRVRDGVSCYEVAWNKLDGDTTTQTEFYTTVEPQELFARCFPELVDRFKQDLLAKGKSKGKPRKKASKPSKQTIDDIEVVTSEFSSLQIPTDDEDDSCSIITDGSTARTWMQDSNGGDEVLDDSCVLVQTPSHDVRTFVNSSSDVRFEDALTRDSFLAEVHDTDNSKEMTAVVEPVVFGTDESCSDSDDDFDVFLPLSERLRQQKATGLTLDAVRNLASVTRTQDVTCASVIRNTSSNSAAVQLDSDRCDIPMKGHNHKADANEFSATTDRLPSTPRQLCLATRRSLVKKCDLTESSKLMGSPEDDISPKAIVHPACASQEISLQFHGRHVEKTSLDTVCLDLADQQEDTVERLCHKSLLIANPLETITPVVDSDVDLHQTFANVSLDSCIEHELSNLSDINKSIECTEQQLDISPRSCGLETNRVSTAGSEEVKHCSMVNSRACLPRKVIMSPDLFDSSYDDDSHDESTLTPSTGCETNHSLCRINHWDVDTPMISVPPGGNHDIVESSAGAGVSSETHRRCCSIYNSSYSRQSIPDNTCSPILKANPQHSTSIERTSLDDSAFACCDSISDNFTRTHPCSHSLVESISGQFGNFDLCSSLLYESDYQSDCNDSVFICADEPPSSGDISSSSSGCRTKQKNQYPYDDVSTRPPQSDIRLHDSPAIQTSVLEASHDVCTLNCDETMQHVASPVCLADRLKLRLAKTNKAHLVSCLSRDANTTSS